MSTYTGGRVHSVVFLFILGLVLLSVAVISFNTNKSKPMTYQSSAAGNPCTLQVHCLSVERCVGGICVVPTRTPTPFRTSTPTLVTCVSTGSCEVSGRACCSGTKRYDLSCFATRYRCTPRPSATPTIFRTRTPTSYRSRTPTPNPCIHVDLDECRARCPGNVCTNTGCSAGRYKCGSIVPTNTPTQSTSGCGVPLLPYAAVGQGGFQLGSNYVPPNLVNAQSALPDVIVRNGSTEKVTRSAVAPIKRLSDLAKSKGYKLVILDGYRSYQEQEQIHNENPDGSAPPGQSAHQLGVSLDVELEDSTGRRIALTNDIIAKVDDFGMLHPIATDRPHIFVLEGTVANSATVINNLQSQINSGQSYYSQMNQQIIQQQISCGINN